MVSPWSQHAVTMEPSCVQLEVHMEPTWVSLASPWEGGHDLNLESTLAHLGFTFFKGLLHHLALLMTTITSMLSCPIAIYCEVNKPTNCHTGLREQRNDIFDRKYLIPLHRLLFFSNF